MNYFPPILLGLLENKINRFLFTGLINTVFGYAIYASLIYLRSPYLIALLVSTILGIIFNFFSFRSLVFGGSRNWFVYSKFTFAYFLIYLFNCCALIILTKKFAFGPYLGQVLCILPSVILSWILMNYWVYKKD